MNRAVAPLGVPDPPIATIPDRGLWERWQWIWHSLHYSTLVLATAIDLLSGDPDGSPTVAIGLSCALGAWYWLMILRQDTWTRRDTPRALVYLGVAMALWFPLAGQHWAYFLVVSPFYGQMWGLLPFGWAVAGNVLLTALIPLRQAVTTGRFDLIFDWPLLVGVMSVGWAVVFGSWIHAVMRESRERQRLVEELRATRANLAMVEHQAGVLEERQRLAREIHDTLAQGFTSIVMQLEAADQTLPFDHAEVRARIARARDSARDGLAETRRLVLALRPEPLEGASLPEALERVARRWSEEASIPAVVTVTGDRGALHPDVEVTLLRAAQEALANARKHARAGQVSLTLSYMGDQVALDVQDDGVGFDPQALTSDMDRGFGLRSMRERIQQLGGSVSVESAPGQGTTVAVAIPLAQTS